MRIRHISAAERRTRKMGRKKRPGFLLRAALTAVLVAVFLIFGAAISRERAGFADVAEVTDLYVANGFPGDASDGGFAGSNENQFTRGGEASSVQPLAHVVGASGSKIAKTAKPTVEVDGQGRHVVVSDDVELVRVTGANSVVHIMGAANVGRIELLESAVAGRIMIDGNVGTVDLAGKGAFLTGTGRIDTVVINGAGARITVKYDNVIDNTDHGLSGAYVSITAPDSIPTGKLLIASAEIGNAEPGKTCSVVWYINGVSVLESTITTDDKVPELTYTMEYDRHAPEVAAIGVIVTYEPRLGDKHVISDEVPVKLENHNMEYWTRRDAAEVLNKVTTGYKGDFTLEWAQENDYTEYEKEVWINAKGYSSDSEYLIWISIAYQRVNIFKGSEKDWELIHSCIVATGAPGRGTMTGVCKTTYKQKYGWTTRDYTCKPVVRFRAGTGYAFHSRLYYPNSDKLKDTRIGFPISLGCIRMYDEDIQFIYDYIPDGSTVVVF